MPREWSDLLLEHADAVGADVLAAEVDDVAGIIAEDASGLILLQDNGVPLYVDLHGVLLSDVQGPPELYREHDAAELVDLSNDAG